MIVISIATALALAHGVQTLHHRHLAHEAGVKIDAEIQVNVRELDEALKPNNDQLKIIQATREQLLAGIYANMRDVQLISASGANNFLDGAGMLNTISDIRMGDGDPKAIYRMLSQMIGAYSSTDGNLRALRDNLARSAAEAPHA